LSTFIESVLSVDWKLPFVAISLQDFRPRSVKSVNGGSIFNLKLFLFKSLRVVNAGQSASFETVKVSLFEFETVKSKFLDYPR
jgi:hypothetical protein